MFKLFTSGEFWATIAAAYVVWVALEFVRFAPEHTVARLKDMTATG